MSLAGSIRTGLAQRDWAIARDSGLMITYWLAVDAVAVIWSVIALERLRTDDRSLPVLLLLVALALGFEEGSRRVGRLRFRMSADLKHDMTSVWSIASAVALAPGYVVVLHVVLFGYLWFRQWGPAGEPLYRKVVTGSAAVISCLTAGLVMHAAQPAWTALPWMLSGAMSVFVVVVVHAVLNRALITGALLLVGVRGTALVGSRDDNLAEFATLCLGGLVALAALHEPMLCVLVVPPMVSLQRGSVVGELELAATIDSKTGLFNAVAWERVAQRELARAIREGTSLAVLLIDIDRFKLVNDRYGHLIGDAVLQGVGRCLDAEVREYDSVGRFGGEEFVAVLPAAGDADALVVAERLRSRINALHVSQFDARIAAADDTVLAVSIGVACTPADGTELPDLLHAADGALYGAKAAGRNRVLLAGRGEGGGAPDRLALS